MSHRSLMNKQYKIWIVVSMLLVASCLLGSFSFAENQSEVLLGKNHYGYFEWLYYDRNDDKKRDKEVLLSWAGVVVLESYDENFDGEFDKTVYLSTLRNVKVTCIDKNFDRRTDILLFEFPDQKKYQFIDKDFNRVFDEFTVEPKIFPIPMFIMESTHNVWFSYYFLLKFLKDKNLNQEFEYALHQFTTKYKELDLLLQQNKWNELLVKTLEYLDAPTLQQLPIVLIPATKKVISLLSEHAKAITIRNKICFDSEDIDMYGWLRMIQHEVIHVAQNKRKPIPLRRSKIDKIISELEAYFGGFVADDVEDLEKMVTLSEERAKLLFFYSMEDRDVKITAYFTILEELIGQIKNKDKIMMIFEKKLIEKSSLLLEDIQKEVLNIKDSISEEGDTEFKQMIDKTKKMILKE